MVKTILVTGSSGLIGSEVAAFFSGLGFIVHGIDNNQRAYFFGKQGDTSRNRQYLEHAFPAFVHYNLDIRDRQKLADLIKQLKPAAIIHAAAQPSHDLAASIPFDDFDTNAVGTLNLLEAARNSCPESPFIFLSSNKVYGDLPNRLSLVESATRWDFDDPAYRNGIPETFPVDQCTHSLMGASKLAADIMVQEYGRYFGMPTCCLRGGCLTGPNHAGVELHGFLNYLVKCNLEGREYNVYGHGGKQVRDNLHATDVASLIAAIIETPRCGEVYNMGGGREHSCSILEAFTLTEKCSGIPQKYRFTDRPRIGDHLCYYSNLTKLHSHYPQWRVTISLERIISGLVEHWHDHFRRQGLGCS